MRKYITIIFAIMILCMAAAGCGGKSAGTEKTGGESTAVSSSADQGETDASSVTLPYRFADKEEGIELLMANEVYFDGFSENDLEYKMQKKNADMEEYKAFARDQVCDFTDEEKALIDDHMASIRQKIADEGYHLPPLKEIVFICTTMEEEGGAAAYTHGTQIYIGKEALQLFANEEYSLNLEYLLAHELFHCLTRSSPDFRTDMYNIIHFTVQEKEYPIPPSVMDYFISNPDVEHHNAYAEFVIDGEPVDCFMAVVTRKHFEKEGEQFFDTATAALVPVDGTDVYYYPEDASNYDEVLGKNTEYTIDPEECMADNFSFAIVFGMDGPNGDGYETPEIIESIMTYLKEEN